MAGFDRRQSPQPPEYFWQPDKSLQFCRTTRISPKDTHGGHWSEWPGDLRVREMPGGYATFEFRINPNQTSISSAQRQNFHFEVVNGRGDRAGCGEC